MILFLCLHALFDFDLQYPALVFPLLILLDYSPCEKPKRSRILLPSAVLLAGLSPWIGLSSFRLWLGDAEGAVRTYPAYTTALVRMLPDAPPEEQEALADRILSLNKSVALAHDAKAHARFAQGDMLSMIEHKQEAMRLAKYDLDEYLDYLDLLIYARQLYSGSGDSESASLCTALMQAVPEKLREAEAGTSSLGWRIRDLPDLELPASYRQILEKSS